MAASPDTPLIFYDLALAPPFTETCRAVNPWKSRLALNFTGVPYKTQWVPLPDISRVRTELGVPACRKFADGTDFHTLPILQDPTTETFVGDSFDIALYLHRTYGADLFPSQELDFECAIESRIPLSDVSKAGFPEYARFNMNVDAAFTAHIGLIVHRLPLDPASADVTKAEFVRRAGVKSWDDFALTGEKRDQMLASFHDMLGDLARLFARSGGPFLMGERVSYADLIVGGWWRMIGPTLPEQEWEGLRTSHGDVFGRLHDALDVYARVE